MKKKAFFLSLTAFMVITFITASISLKMLAVDETRQSYVEMTRLSSYQLSFSAVNKKALEKDFESLLAFSIYAVANHSAYYPVVSEQKVPEVIHDVFLYGYSPPGNFKGDVREEKEKELNVTSRGSYLYAVMDKLNTSLTSLGLRIKEFEIPGARQSGWNIELADYRTVEFETPINITVEDFRGKSSIMLNYTLRVSVDIEGMPDPLTNRVLIEKGLEPKRVIYFSSSEQFPSLSSPSKYPVDVGQGWAYGLLASPDNRDLLSTVVLHGKFDEVSTIGGLSGYIVNGTPSTKTITCGSDPEDYPEGEVDTFNALYYFEDNGDCREELRDPLYAPVDGSDEGDAPDGRGSMFANLEPDDFSDLISSLNEGEGYLFLVVNDDGDVVEAPTADEGRVNPRDAASTKEKAEMLEVYDIKEQREAVVKGYYFKWDQSYSDTYSFAPPNFFQRMVDPSLSDREKGIFSFLIVEEFKDGNNPVSRADFERARGVTDNLVVVRGMSGCKDAAMCSLDPEEYNVGRFAISSDLAELFGLLDIACSWDDAKEGCYG